MEQPRGRAAMTDAEELMAELRARQGRLCNRVAVVLPEDEIAVLLITSARTIHEWAMDGRPGGDPALQVWLDVMYSLSDPMKDYIAAVLSETHYARTFDVTPRT